MWQRLSETTMKALLLSLVIVALHHLARAQEPFVEVSKTKNVVWCCLSDEELAKCEAFSKAAERDNLQSEYTFGSYYRHIQCRKYQNKDECMRRIDEGSIESPDVMNVDAGEVFVAGRYHSLVPILREVREANRDFYNSLAVVKAGTLLHVETLEDLRGLKACFPQVGSLAAWTVPINKLIQSGVMEVVDCNNHVKSAINFFGTSCAVNSLQDRYNPLGDNPHHFCELCGSDTPGVRCTPRDPYSGYEGALQCLREKGDIAFLNEHVIFESGDNPQKYELLCPQEDGSFLRRPVSQFQECSWGISPGNALVVSSAMDMADREALQIFLRKAVEIYDTNIVTTERPVRNTTAAPAAIKNQPQVKQSLGPDADNQTTQTQFVNGFPVEPDEREEDLPFYIFQSVGRYGALRNLMFSDATKQLAIIKPHDMSYKSYLGRGYGGSTTIPFTAIEGVRKCPIGQMTLCVTSEAEMIKCVRMRTALKAQLLEPQMSCKKASNHVECMALIAKNEADVTVLDAGDIYKAGWQFGLIPIMAEVYNLGTPDYYAVAVSKQRDNSSELIYLKRKNTCHTGVGQAAGWIIPMAWLLANERVRDYQCDSIRAAAEYFSKACAPGAISSNFVNKYEANFHEYSHLCDLCHGIAGHFCDRNHMEDYYGHTGAFRCLVEGGGNVAFVKHTTVMENCDGKRKHWWARNQLTTDYELLCRDGTRAPARNYKKCFIGKVKANAIVTSPRYGEKKIETFINLFKYAQQFYGQKIPDEFSFSMFYSAEPYADLIFQDATQQLYVLPIELRHYTTYLDKDFLKSYSVVECRSRSWATVASPFLMLLAQFGLYFALQRLS